MFLPWYGPGRRNGNKQEQSINQSVPGWSTYRCLNFPFKGNPKKDVRKTMKNRREDISFIVLTEDISFVVLKEDISFIVLKATRFYLTDNLF